MRKCAGGNVRLITLRCSFFSTTKGTEDTKRNDPEHSSFINRDALFCTTDSSNLGRTRSLRKTIRGATLHVWFCGEPQPRMRRQVVASGASHWSGDTKVRSPGWGDTACPVANEFAVLVPPLRGCGCLFSVNQRLTPLATTCRRIRGWFINIRTGLRSAGPRLRACPAP